ncbi:aminotransferase class I/II-fold pyridoxal phosphate-dependent enzyme [Kyrpidia sp.]|uniref:pyridoxal phosphate-dependent decarboxylase family protein n=1 Tax=Kyrpidia sp. TaxID=2073077 RepID=UPI0025846C91|nr:aminotransferase class I/II-fold pyridoxal phosphate-dependent enzyme [Kyrpidia sp.]MCL6577553.1 aminotransferase class I/II-fold pyridoxal phosphate-dependent enzyme [Kyrpidia sp.]
MEKVLTVDPSNHRVARAMARRVADMVIDHFASLANRPVWHEGDAWLPADGRSGEWAEILIDMRSVLEHSMQVAHPKFFGHMDSGPLLVAVLADWVASALNQNMLAWELSPLATAVEEEVIAWLCALCGMDHGEGSLVSGGTVSNLTALLLALQSVTQGRFRTEGVWALRRRPVIFASDQAHYSVVKSAATAGLGEQSVVKISTDDAFRMDPERLRTALREVRASDASPVMVVATVGTTSTGSVDPVDAVADICREYGVWLHVDAAHGGALLFSEQKKHLLKGIDRADSVTVDPHKWLMQPKSMGAILTRHKGALRNLFESGAPYLTRKNETSARPQSRGGMSLQGSRRFDALRLWVTRRYLGDSGLTELVERNLAQVRAWADLLRAHPAFELAHEPELNLLCFRYRPAGVADERLDAINEEIQRELMRSGEGFLSVTSLRGRRWLRSVFINPTTREEDMRAVLDSIEKIGQRLYGR